MESAFAHVGVAGEGAVSGQGQSVASGFVDGDRCHSSHVIANGSGDLNIAAASDDKLSVGGC